MNKKTITEWCNEKWNDPNWQNNICAPEMSDKEALDFLFHYLEPDYYISYCCNRFQANTEFVCLIIKEYSKLYKKEKALYKKLHHTDNKQKVKDKKLQEQLNKIREGKLD